MRDFDYHLPSSLAEAASLLTGDATLMAGGQTLIPTLKLGLASFDAVIDLAGVAELKNIAVGGGSVTVGAMARHADVARSAEVAAAIPALSILASQIGDVQVRHRGTIGGSIANNDPAADYPAAVVALNATIHTNKRDIAADDFFTGMFETALTDAEIITAVTFPVPDTAAYQKFPNPASRYAMVGVMVARTSGGIRVAVTGAGPCVFRVSEMETALAGDFSTAAIAGIEVPADDLNADIHGSAEYRAHLIGVMAQRAVAIACRVR